MANDSPRADWLVRLTEGLEPDRRERFALPRETRRQLQRIPELAHAPASLWAELAWVRECYRPEYVERRLNLVRNAEAWRPVRARTGALVRTALDKLGLALVQAYILNLEDEFEAACPNWRSHAAALLGLRPVADRLARRGSKTGRRQEPARGLARRVADVLARHEIAPTSTKGGTFCEVVAKLLDSLEHLGPHDAEWYVKAIVHERNSRDQGPEESRANRSDFPR